MNKKTIIGLVIFVILIGIIVFYKTGKKIITGDLTTIYVATGGGKEDFLKDEEVLEILKKEYKIDVVFDTWSNSKTVSSPLIRETIGLGNQDIINRMENGETFTINSPGVTKYDALFTSDIRYYDYYKQKPVNDEAERYTVLGGGLTLNTPIVFYSWDKIVDALIAHGIAEEKDGIYYVVDMDQLVDIILNGKKWSELGVTDDIYGNVSISSIDPVKSSPGATYYGLLLAILSKGELSEENVIANMPKLKELYVKSGNMKFTPADLFQEYLRAGMGTQKIIVDYEKSIIDFSNSNKKGFEQVKDRIRVLYPKPTSWNNHCYMYFTENGEILYKAFEENEKIQQIAWEKYGFRTGITGGKYDVSKIGIAVPQEITSTVSGLKMAEYNALIEGLK
ncbi:MAG: hypothetical protein IKR74_01920 [Bacilli bacterium]|nr:hypothetical protein [Bacilli bacterium]